MELQKSIFEELECPVCKEIMHPPIRTCMLGHNFCNTCDDHLVTCPVCRGDKGFGRNFCLEALHNEMILPCKNHAEGCSYQGEGRDVEEHEEECDFGFIECPVKEVCGCTWTGMRGDIMAHLGMVQHLNN